jgi:hypothetical protein
VDASCLPSHPASLTRCASSSSLLPPHLDEHPLGCHRRRIADAVIFDKLVEVLVYGAGYERIADDRCSSTTLRRRCDAWIRLGIWERLRLATLDA